MQRILDVRIVRWYFKLAYAGGAWLVGYVVQSLLELVDVADVALNVLGSSLTLGAILLGARVFRGRDEPLVPSRAWWRMTARRPLSWVLGILAVVGAVSTAVTPLLGRGTVTLSAANSVINLVWYVVLAFVYLNSAVRLGRAFARPAVSAGPGRYSVTAITEGVVRVLREHDLSGAPAEDSARLVRVLLTRGSVDRASVSAALGENVGTLTEATWAALLSDLNALVVRV